MAWVQPDGPPQQKMVKAPIGVNVEETLFMSPPGSLAPEQFLLDHISVAKMCKMMACPVCCLFVPFQGKTNKLEYSRDCGPCSCPYKVTLNGTLAGNVKDVGCCDNGCWFCCCSCFTCSGHIKLMGMEDATGTEKFTFLKELFCCWVCVEKCGLGCAPCCAVLRSCAGCYHYCEATEFQKITQPVYAGPWNRGMDAKPEQLGEFVITNRFQPISCCCAVPTPTKYYFKPTTPAGHALTKEDLTNLSLVLQLYRGMPGPCKACSCVGFQRPTGVLGLDFGLNTKSEWISIQQVMEDSS